MAVYKVRMIGQNLRLSEMDWVVIYDDRYNPYPLINLPSLFSVLLITFHLPPRHPHALNATHFSSRSPYSWQRLILAGTKFWIIV